MRRDPATGKQHIYSANCCRFQQLCGTKRPKCQDLGNNLAARQSILPCIRAQRHLPALWFLWALSTMFTYLPALWFLWALSTVFTYLPALWFLWALSTVFTYLPALWFLWALSTMFTYLPALWFLWALSTMFTYLPALDLSLGLSCQWPRGTTEGPAQGVPVHNISSKFHTLVYYTLPPPRKVPESEALSVCASAGLKHQTLQQSSGAVWKSRWPSGLPVP